MRRPPAFAPLTWFIAAAALAVTFATIDVGAQGGGQGVGNGGGGWICRENDAKKSLRWIQTLDLFEAEHEWGYTPKRSEADEFRQISDALGELRPLMPEFVADTEKALKIARKGVLVQGPLPRRERGSQKPIQDDIATVPPGVHTCPNGTWERIQLAVFYDPNELEIDRDWYRLLPKTERAALYLHEAIYLLLRKGPGKDPNSIRTRQIVGILLSTLPAEHKAQLIRYQLDHPEIQNRETVLERDGKFNALQGSEKLQLTEYFFARMQTLFKDSPVDAATEVLIQGHEKIAQKYGEDAAAARRFVQDAQPVSVLAAKAKVDSLPAIDPLKLLGLSFDCVRYIPFGVGLPEGKGWYGFFFRPALFNEDNITGIRREDWNKKLVVDFDSMTLVKENLLIRDGTLLWEKNTSTIDVQNYWRALGQNELLGFSVVKKKESKDFFDMDYSPMLFFCKPRKK